MLAALAVYSARRRIVFALKTGAVVYIVLLFARLLLSAGSLGERWEELVWPVFFILVAWAVLWRGGHTLCPGGRQKSPRGPSRCPARGQCFSYWLPGPSCGGSAPCTPSDATKASEAHLKLADEVVDFVDGVNQQRLSVAHSLRFVRAIAVRQ